MCYIGSAGMKVFSEVSHKNNLEETLKSFEIQTITEEFFVRNCFEVRSATDKKQLFQELTWNMSAVYS